MTLIDDGIHLRGEVRTYVLEGDLAPTLLSDPQRLCEYLDGLEPTGLYFNTVTNVGRQAYVQRIVAETTANIGYTGLTTSATTPSLTLTALTNEILRKANSVNQSYLTYTMRHVSYHSTVDWGSTGIAGIGLFDTASTGGQMFAAASISVSKTTTQSLVTDYRVTATT